MPSHFVCLINIEKGKILFIDTSNMYVGKVCIEIEYILVVVVVDRHVKKIYPENTATAHQ